MANGIGGMVKVVGIQDADEGGSYIGELDVDFRSLKIGHKIPIKDVAANYTVQKEDTGWILAVSAAATITLPTPDSTWEGAYVDIIVVADVAVVIATQTTDTLVTKNDVAADSVTWNTATEQIGTASRFVAHNIAGTMKWMQFHMSEETVTETVAT